MRFRVVAVGKPRNPALASLITNYEQRAGRYWPLDVAEVREEGAGDTDIVRRRESERLLARADGGVVVVCDERGETFTSVAFAEWMQQRREAARDIAFLIGGANGIDTALRDAASYRLRLAPWTLPHELARLVLAEQLYRAGTIIRREPYHRE